MPEIKEKSSAKDVDLRVLVADTKNVKSGWLKENMQRERQQGRKSSEHSVLRWSDREEQVL